MKKPVWTTPDRLVLLLSLLLVGAVYAALAWRFSAYHAFWSPDSGVRFAMIRSWLEQGDMIYLPYPGAAADPTGVMHPMGTLPGRMGYVLPLAKGYTTIYPPLFPFLCGLCYRLFGFYGLTFVPMLSGLGTLVFVFAVAKRLGLYSRFCLPLALGLTTPLMLYSVLFWDHAALMFFTALTAYLLLRSLEGQEWRRGLALGAMMGIGAWVHELFMAAFAAVFVAGLPGIREAKARRLLTGMLLGFGALMAAWAVTNLAVYGLLGGPHFVGAKRFFEPQYYDDARSLAGFWRRGMLQLVGASSGYFALLGVFLFACVLLGWTSPRLRRLAPLAYVGGAWVAWRISGQVPTVNGLFMAAPALLPAMTLTWKTEAADTPPDAPAIAPAFVAWLSRASWLYMLAVFANPMTPALDWGSRYLLTVLPFLALLSAYALERGWTRAGKGERTEIAAVAALLIVVSGLIQPNGLKTVQKDLEFSRLLNEGAKTVHTPALVSDLFWLTPETTPTPLRTVSFYVRGGRNEWERFLDGIERAGWREFTFYGSPGRYIELMEVARRRPRAYTNLPLQYGYGLPYGRFVALP